MNKFWGRVLLTSLLVGTTDITAAYINQFIKTGKFADKMLQYIAGGVLGLERSMLGGFWVGALGLLFHYFIAFSFTLLFFLVYPRLKFLWYNPYVTGFLYGVFASCFMGFVVLPLTRLPQGPFVLQRAVVGWIILGVVLGIPVAVSCRWFYKSRYAEAVARRASNN